MLPRMMLHYGYAPGCPHCHRAFPAVEAAVRRTGGAVELRPTNLEAGEAFPGIAMAVPALALTAPGAAHVWVMKTERLRRPLDEAAVLIWLQEGFAALRGAR